MKMNAKMSSSKFKNRLEILINSVKVVCVNKNDFKY